MGEESLVIQQRREKAEALERSGVPLYPNAVAPPQAIGPIVEEYGTADAGSLEGVCEEFRVSGRVMSLRRFGKAAFLHIQDATGRIQVHVAKDRIGTDAYDVFKKFDIGDIVSVTGRPFRTKTGELTLEAASISLVTKSLYPLPEKYHGVRDVELRYRQRYVDLIMNREVREVFRTRSRIIRIIREYLTTEGFLEVETPMMQPIVGGATARPFMTHHNALGIDLYLRIAPELYLKRLLVGGFDRVFELNRNFRNEGISTQHNPEFTMLEFYEAYATYEDLMARTEALFTLISKEINGGLVVQYQGESIDLTPPWRRMTLVDSLVQVGGVPERELSERAALEGRLRDLGNPVKGNEPFGRLLTKLFDLLVEPRLVNPTFITHYPTDVSPLARRNAADPSVTDRFELFIAGREMGNAFSELNDPRDQEARFREQIEKRGDDEEIPPVLDEDYIHALKIGMPPAAGEGIGIDRLVMLFTDSPSIRDVILFPQLRPST